MMETQESQTQEGRSRPRRSAWLHRFALLTAWCTFLLIFIGGLVTSTGSGLAVPDWPLANGQIFPPMAGGVLYEHGHRLAAGAVGLLTVVLAAWIAWKEPRKRVRLLAFAGLGAVILQGLLGGATVLLELPLAVSVTHALLAQIFFCITVALAMVTHPRWGRVRPTGKTDLPLQRLCVATTLVIFGQLLLGALMRHSHAGLAIPDFPLAFGGVVPPLSDPKVVIHFLHRMGAVAVTGFVVWTAVTVLRRYPTKFRLVVTAWGMLGLLAFQLVLGALTVWTRMAVIPTTTHVAVGAAVLAVTLMMTLRSYEGQPGRTAVGADRWVAERVPV